MPFTHQTSINIYKAEVINTLQLWERAPRSPIISHSHSLVHQPVTACSSVRPPVRPCIRPFALLFVRQPPTFPSVTVPFVTRQCTSSVRYRLSSVKLRSVRHSSHQKKPFQPFVCTDRSAARPNAHLVTVTLPICRFLLPARSPARLTARRPAHACAMTWTSWK